jgi:hypothetical protein
MLMSWKRKITLRFLQSNLSNVKLTWQRIVDLKLKWMEIKRNPVSQGKRVKMKSASLISIENSQSNESRWK